MTLGHFEAGGGWEAQIRQYVRKKYRQDLAGLAGLDPRALAALFRGELVPQDPNDEPAEKLLERIMEEKAKMEGDGRQKAKSRKRRAKV